MKIFSYLLFFIFFLLLNDTLLASIEEGKWNFVKDDDYCYIGSTPINREIEKGKKRGITYILVYRINKSPETIVQIEAGYPYDQKKNVEVNIDKVSYEFFSEEGTPETAWTDKDKEVIFANSEANWTGIFLERRKDFEICSILAF